VDLVTTPTSAAPDATSRPCSSVPRRIGRVVLGAFLLFAGYGHFARTEDFLAQVPPFLPAPEAIVYASGVVELGLGSAVIAAPRRWRPWVGGIVAAFFVAIFPGNISQALTDDPAFGLDTPTARWTRLAFQPLLLVWALWSTGAWSAWRARRGRD
jgi:uncharacterized membrane protein